MTSHFKYCQGTMCHTYKTKDRIRGMKGNKHYETRKNGHFYNDEFCSNICRDDWFNTFGKRAIDHFGRIHEPKRTMADSAWYKAYDWRNGTNYYFVNDLLGQRIPITQEQYNDDNFTSPTN
jgi:hypothetical protein